MCSFSKVFLHSLGLWCSEFCECIEDSSAGFDFGDLSVEVDGHETLAQQFDAVHFGFDQGASVVAAPFLPKRASQMLDGS